MSFKKLSMKLRHCTELFQYVHIANKSEMTKGCGNRWKIISMLTPMHNSATAFVRNATKKK